jgi:hypothetical protein
VENTSLAESFLSCLGRQTPNTTVRLRLPTSFIQVGIQDVIKTVVKALFIG